jgi:hypothetical protein
MLGYYVDESGIVRDTSTCYDGYEFLVEIKYGYSLLNLVFCEDGRVDGEYVL